MNVKHGSDSIEAEPVKTKVIDPHPEVGKQESQCLPITVVEKSTAPQRVMTTITRVEEAGVYGTESICERRK